MFGNVVFRSLLRFLAALEPGGRRARAGGDDLRRRSDRVSAQRAHGAARGGAAAAARWHSRIEAFCHWQVFAMALFGGWLAWQMMLSRWDERTPYLGLRAVWFAVPMIAGMALLAYFAFRRVLLAPRPDVVAAGIAVALLVAGVLAIAAVLGTEARTYALSVAFADLRVAARARGADRLRTADGDAALSLHLEARSAVGGADQPAGGNQQLRDAVDSVLHPRRLRDDRRRPEPAAHRVRDRAGRPLSRRHAAGDRGVHVHHVGHLGLEGRRRRRGRHDHEGA